MLGRICSCLLAFASLALPYRVWGQSNQSPLVGESRINSAYTLSPRRPQPPPVVFGFSQMAQAAGIIFSGRVTAISPSSSRESSRQPSSHVEAVAITFHVEQAIRGATPGKDLTISQWVGLWASGQRYRVGEHVLLFLYPPSKLGLTSRVGGSLGRFSVSPDGQVLLSPEHLSAFGASPIMHGRSQIPFSEFAKAVSQARGEE